MPRAVHGDFLPRKLENRCEGGGGAIDQELRFAARNKPRGHIAAGTGIDFLDPRVTIQIFELDGLERSPQGNDGDAAAFFADFNGCAAKEFRKPARSSSAKNPYLALFYLGQLKTAYGYGG